MNTTNQDLPVEWSTIDGEGLVRVYPVANFMSGFALTAQIGMASESIGIYPEVRLTSDKVIVTIEPDSEGLDHQLAHAIDAALSDATKQ